MKVTFDTKLDILAPTRKKVAAILNQVLANLTDLHSQTKQAHWNVRGPQFYSQHKLFDEVAGSVETHIDPIAERIVQLGFPANGTIRQAAAKSALDEFPTQQDGELGYTVALTDRFAQCGAAVRKAINDTANLGDADTADLLTNVSEDLDKGLWFLEAHTRK